MNINDLYLIMGYFSRQLGSGFVGPDRFNEYCQLVNFQYYKKYLGLPEEWQIDNPISRIQYQLTQAVSDRIYPFIVPQKPISKAISGYYPYPEDYVAFSSMRIRHTTATEDCGTSVIVRRVEMIPDAEFTNRLESMLFPPTIRRPAGTWTQFGYDVAPAELNTVLLTYLRLPAVPKRLYTAGDVYVPTGSVQFEFPQICLQDILMLLLKAAGISVQDQEVIAYANKAEKEGI